MVGFDRARLRIAVVLLALPGSTAASAYDFKCPAPTEQVANDVKADLDGQAQALIGSGTAAVKGRFESTVVDLFSKYQNSDRVAIAQNFLGPACDFLKAANIPDEQKYERWLQIAPLVEKYFHDERPRNGGQSVGTMQASGTARSFIRTAGRSSRLRSPSTQSDVGAAATKTTPSATRLRRDFSLISSARPIR